MSTGSSPTSRSRFRFLDESGAECVEFTEWRRGYVEILGVEREELEDVHLLRNGRTLPIRLQEVAGEYRVIAEWPLSSTGHYELSLSLAGETVRRTERVVPEKITMGEFTLLLEQLTWELPASIAISAQALGGLGGVQAVERSELTLAEELARLQRAVDGTDQRKGLVQVLPEMQRQPHRLLTRTSPWVPRSRARQPDVTKLGADVSTPGNLDRDGLPSWLFDTRVSHSFDVYENQIVKAFATEVENRLRRLSRFAPAGLTPQVHDLRESIRRAREAATFLREVGDLRIAPTRVSMVLARRPEYRAALDGLIALRRSLMAWLDEPMLDAPLENVPGLYELWCLLGVVSAIQERAADEGFVGSPTPLCSPRPGSVFVSVRTGAGQPLVELRRGDLEVRVFYQWSFAYGAAGFRSVTFEQIPDIVVEVKVGSDVRLHVLDPKYKLDSERLRPDALGSTDGDLESADEADERVSSAPLARGRPKKLDIDKMHAYRDAIRGLGDEHVVRYAAILYPGPLWARHHEIEALPARPSNLEGLKSVVADRFSGWLEA